MPNFSELSKVRVDSEEFGIWEGYVVGMLFRNGRWIYKVSLSENPKETFDNWLPEESLKPTK